MQSSSIGSLHDQTESDIYARLKLKTYKTVLCSCATLSRSMIGMDEVDVHTCYSSKNYPKKNM